MNPIPLNVPDGELASEVKHRAVSGGITSGDIVRIADRLMEAAEEAEEAETSLEAVTGELQDAEEWIADAKKRFPVLNDVAI